MERGVVQQQYPLLVTVFLGMCGWGIVHVADRFTEAPTVEYCMDVEWLREGRGSIRVDVINMSHFVLLRNLTLRLGPVSGRFENPTIFGTPPAFQDGVHPTVAEGEVAFHIPYFHPGARFSAKTDYVGEVVPELVVVSEHGAVLLMECSMLTGLLKCRMTVIIGLTVVAVWLVVGLLRRKGDCDGV